jgi:hypothetical protein
VRLLAKVTIPLEARDGDATKRGDLPLKMRIAMRTLKPESAYFAEEAGRCDCYFVFELDWVTLLQPLFPGIDADFHVTPVMNAAEFQTLGSPPRGDEPTVGEADLVTDLRPEANKPPERLKPLEPERPYVTTQGERDLRAKKLLEED